MINNDLELICSLLNLQKALPCSRTKASLLLEHFTSLKGLLSAKEHKLAASFGLTPIQQQNISLIRRILHQLSKNELQKPGPSQKNYQELLQHTLAWREEEGLYYYSIVRPQ